MGVVDGVSVLVEELGIVGGGVPDDVEDVRGATDDPDGADLWPSFGADAAQALATSATAIPRKMVERAGRRDTA